MKTLLLSLIFSINASATLLPAPADIAFMVTVAVPSLTAANPLDFVTADSVPDGKKIYLLGYRGSVAGAAFSALADCTIEDTTGDDFAVLPGIDLTAAFFPGDIGTSANPYILNTGGADSAGLRIVCSANAAAGSTLTVTAWGIIK